MNRIVLGHPYSGALFAYFRAQRTGEELLLGSDNGHSYYRTLYGNATRQHLGLALTFLLLYDDVWITPADAHMPLSRIDPGNWSFIPELRLHADWDDYRPSTHGAHHDACIAAYLQDPQLKRLLGQILQVPKVGWFQIVSSAVYEASLSARKRCRLICSRGRRLIIERLIEIDRPSLHPVFSGTGAVQFVETYLQASGMALAAKSLDDLLDAKPDATVRQYGARFLELAHDTSPMPTKERELLLARLTLEAMNAKQTEKLFNGAMSWGGALLRMVDMTCLSALVSGGSFVASQLQEGVQWHEFKGAIDQSIDRSAFVRKMEALVAEAPDA